MKKWHYCKSHYLCSDNDRMTPHDFKMSVECLENILSFLVMICLRKSDKRQLRNRNFKKIDLCVLGMALKYSMYIFRIHSIPVGPKVTKSIETLTVCTRTLVVQRFLSQPLYGFRKKASNESSNYFHNAQNLF